jgi:ribokinase
MEAWQTGKIGDDDIGDQFRKTLGADGVDDRYVVTKENGTTLHTYILTAPGGKHCIFANPGDAVCSLMPEELPESLMSEMDIFYNDMFSPETALWLAEQAVQQGKPVLYNMQCVPSFMELCGTSMGDIEKMMGLCTVFVSGRDGYFELTGEKDYRKAMKQVQEKYHVKDGVICTAGSEGAVWYDGQEYSAPAYEIETVDTTGAGDCFLGGLLYSYFSEGMEKTEALAFANASAAVKCMQPGPRSRADLETIRGFMDSKRKNP